ncbi:hypothetical protein C8Q70DRAFT_463541 [Cubamyces menziesii]|nr:hypothetical protein C8Q70DRAFT_463541 [Cubamyces menziesii]
MVRLVKRARWVVMVVFALHCISWRLVYFIVVVSPSVIRVPYRDRLLPFSFPRTRARDLSGAVAACQLRMSWPDCSYILSIWSSYLPRIAKTSCVARPQRRQLAKEPSICGCVSIACNCSGRCDMPVDMKAAV